MALQQMQRRSPVFVLQNRDADLTPEANTDSVMVASNKFTVEAWNASGSAATDFDGGTVTVYKKADDGTWVPLYAFTEPGVRYGERGDLPIEVTAGLSGAGGSANACVTVTP